MQDELSSENLRYSGNVEIKHINLSYSGSRKMKCCKVMLLVLLSAFISTSTAVTHKTGKKYFLCRFS